MSNVIKKVMKVFFLGLVLIAIVEIAAAQNSGEKITTDPQGIFSNTTNPENISEAALAIPAVATAQFKIYDYVEINTDQDLIPPGTLSGRQWGSLQIINKQDSSQTILGNISETLEGDSFTKPEYSEYATWNSTDIHWIFPPDIVVNEEISWRTDVLFMVDYYTSAMTQVYNPVKLTRYVNKSVFISDGYQFNSYEVIFENNNYEDYSGRIAYEETTYTNSSILNNTFTTDLPLTSLTPKSYIDPISKRYISEMGFNFNNTSIQLHHPYHFNFTAAIKLKNSAGSSIKSFPRIYLALVHLGPIQQGDSGMTALMPSPLLPAHVSRASATTNVSNLWQYRREDSVKMAFNLTAKIIKQEKIGVYQNGVWFLDNDGSGTWNVGDLADNFGANGWASVTGDWNGDGKIEIGVYKDGVWYQDYNGNGAWDNGIDNASMFGASGWTPVIGDWNSNGKTEIGVYKDGVWYLDSDGSGAWSAGDAANMFGAAGWTPVVGNWNGDATGTKTGVYKDGMWYIDNDGSGTWNTGDRANMFGAPGWTPVLGDWNGDGSTKIGVYKDGTWYLDYNGNGVWDTGIDKVDMFGTVGWTPIVGDWNGTGTTKIGVYKDGMWYLDNDGSGTWNTGDRANMFGTVGWTPVAGKWT